MTGGGGVREEEMKFSPGTFVGLWSQLASGQSTSVDLVNLEVSACRPQMHDDEMGAT